MNTTDKKTDILIKKLRDIKPELNNESLLTDNIMAQIHLSTKRKNLRIFVWIKTLSTAAAVFLLALLLFQESPGANLYAENKKENVKTDMSKIKPPCLINEQQTFAEFYSCYIEYSRSKNKKTLENYINQIKNNSYEDNK